MFYLMGIRLHHRGYTSSRLKSISTRFLKQYYLHFQSTFLCIEELGRDILEAKGRHLFYSSSSIELRDLFPFAFFFFFGAMLPWIACKVNSMGRNKVLTRTHSEYIFLLKRIRRGCTSKSNPQLQCSQTVASSGAQRQAYYVCPRMDQLTQLYMTSMAISTQFICNIKT